METSIKPAARSARPIMAAVDSPAAFYQSVCVVGQGESGLIAGESHFETA
jgi:hypothetical protein